MPQQLARAQGALAGALIGDALGSQVEFMALTETRRLLDEQLLTLHEGGPWHTLAGQPTEDGELMLLLARQLVYSRAYDPQQTLQTYRYWLKSEPFAVTPETQYALSEGALDDEFHAGPLARIVPLAILGVHFSTPQIASWAMADCAITHNSLLAQQLVALYAMVLTHAIDEETDADTLYQDVKVWAHELRCEPIVRHAIDEAFFLPGSQELMERYPMLAALQNLLFQLLYAKSFDDALVDTLRQGGDTGTRATIVGAVFGALATVDGLSSSQLDTLAHCKPQEGVTGVDQPRPDMVWPGDCLQLAKQLVELEPDSLDE